MKKFSLTLPQKIMEGVCAAVLLGMVLGVRKKMTARERARQSAFVNT